MAVLFLLLIGMAHSVPSNLSGLTNRTCSDGYNHHVAGFIDYWWLASCLAEAKYTYIPSLLALCSWMVFLGYLLTSTQQYVAESVGRISARITLSFRIFGVCFLSLSCVPNDIFVGIAGVYHGEYEIILGAILSSTIFMLTVGVGIILLCHQFGTHFKISRRPFLRDLFSLAVCAVTAGIFWYKKTITLWMSLVMIGLYFAYLAFAIGGRIIYQQIRASQGKSLGIIEDEREIFELGISPEADEQTVMLLADMRDQDFRLNMTRDEEIDQTNCCSSIDEFKYHFFQFLGRLVYDGSDWNNKTILGKMFFVIMVPTRILRNITIPTGVDAQWNKPMVLLSIFLSPLFFLVAAEISFGSQFQFPLWGLSLCISFIVFLLVFFTSSVDREPPYHLVLVFASLVMSSIWIYFIGLEFVSTIAVFSVITNMPAVFGGIFALGIANSIASIITLTKMANQGLTNVALSTVWGLPPLKLMLCLGTSFLIGILSAGDLPLSDSSSFMAILVLFCFIPLIIIYTLLVVPCASFKPKKKTAIGYVALYLLFVVAVLVLEQFKHRLFDSF